MGSHKKTSEYKREEGMSVPLQYCQSFQISFHLAGEAFKTEGCA